jgi:hypothetical protein
MGHSGPPLTNEKGEPRISTSRTSLGPSPVLLGASALASIRVPSKHAAGQSSAA